MVKENRGIGFYVGNPEAARCQNDCKSSEADRRLVPMSYRGGWQSLISRYLLQ